MPGGDAGINEELRMKNEEWRAGLVGSPFVFLARPILFINGLLLLHCLFAVRFR